MFRFGVDPPWYNNPVERMAFNLYAMSVEDEREKEKEEEDTE